MNQIMKHNSMIDVVPCTMVQLNYLIDSTLFPARRILC